MTSDTVWKMLELAAASGIAGSAAAWAWSQVKKRASWLADAIAYAWHGAEQAGVLEGLRGAKKTERYMKLLDQMRERDKQAELSKAEIALAMRKAEVMAAAEKTGRLKNGSTTHLPLKAL